MSKHKSSGVFRISKYWILAYLCSMILFFYGCDSLTFHKGIREGVIEYEISYPNIPEGDYMLELMPKKMTTTFANDEYRTDIIAGMGLFKTSIICTKDKKDLIHSVKVLTTKYASNFSEAELRKLNPSFKDLEIVLNSETKEIAGYHCKGADVKVIGDSTWTFKLFYTDDINIQKANNHTPFKEIDGVLMEYEITSYDTHMHFLAISVLDQEVENDAIQLESDYEMVEPEKLKAEIESIFNKVR